MRKLVLIKHARPEIDNNRPASEWALSEEGRLACPALAEAIRPHAPASIVSSDEPKARETAELIGRALNIVPTVAPDLHEHDRSNVRFMPPREFISMMALFFKERSRLVLGRETAEQALRRFDNAVDAILGASGEQNIGVVTHGTVLALIASAHGAGDAFTLWRQLGLPSFLVFALPDFTLIQTVARIGGP